MDSASLRHRLAVVLAADVAGYSRLMSSDEKGTVAALDQAREVFRRSILANQGRVIDMAGDSVLAIFETAAGATASALEIQHTLNDSSKGIPESKRMLFRIGIHLGDLYEKSDGTIYGDGVNVAARLEGLAEPGGVAISDMVFGAVRDKVAVQFKDAGEHAVKNIVRPVRAYYALLEGTPKKNPNISPRHNSIRRWIIGTVTTVLIGLGAIMWLQPWRAQFEAADPTKLAFPLPDKPSIVVLPFNDMSEDKSQEHFSDGMTEDITTDLSKISGLFVVARNSAFTYKEKPIKIRQVAEELGVRFVLEGSVRRSADQVRINAQLIDAISGGHVWADRFDGDVANLFSLQDRITAAIVKQLKVELTSPEKEALSNNDSNVPEAHEAYLIGSAHMKSRSLEALSRAKTSLEKAIELDPMHANARGKLAQLFNLASIRGFLSKLGFDVNDGRELLNKALERPTVHAYRAQLVWMYRKGRRDEIAPILDRMDALEPNYWLTRVWRGNLAFRAGDTASALTFYQEALRLDPANPRTAARIARVYIQEERFAEAIKILEKTTAQDPADRTMSELAAAYALTENLDAGRNISTQLIESRKARGYPSTVAGNFFRHYFSREMTKRLRDGLSRVGIPFQATSAYLGLSADQRVTGKRQLDIVRNVRRIGKNPNGTWMVDHFSDGSGVMYWLGDEVARFDWQVKDDRVFVDFRAPSKRKSYSCEDYSVTDGSRDSYNEFIAVCTHSVATFSTFEIPTEVN